MNTEFYNTTVTTDQEENKEHIQQKRMRTAKYTLSSLLAITGIVILAAQLGPLGLSYLKGRIIQNQSTIIQDPTTASELNPENSDLPYFDPGLSYFQNLIQHVNDGQYVDPAQPQAQRPDENVKIDKNYSKEMILSISSVEIDNIIITPNVDSFEEDIYNAALKKGVAHFKGTPLPGDGGNSFIYGHSAVDSFFSSHRDYAETIFSKLENVEVSDAISITKDGKELTYMVQKKKIANPDDFTVISGIYGKETVTLMTCWPLGIGSQRLIIIGELIDGI